MQPPSVLFGHCFRSDVPTSYGSFGPRSGLKPPSFNFKDLSMKRSQGDYFNVKPVRGSSPTASLAADLSQNFHIDQRFVLAALCPAVAATVRYERSCLLTQNSPQLATPRRSLFSSNLFGHRNGMWSRFLLLSLPQPWLHLGYIYTDHSINRREHDHPSSAVLLACPRHGSHGNVAFAT